MGRRTRAFIAAIDAVLMGFVAFTQTGIPKAIDLTDLVLWGSAVAAFICAYVIWTAGLPFVAWVAIGYVLFGALLTRGAPHWPLLALAVALMPLVPRPRGSLLTGIGIAILAGLAARILVAAFL